MLKTTIHWTFLIALTLVAAPLANAQTCRTDRILSPTPDIRYTDNQDGTVTDKQTGLMWTKCAVGASGDDCKTDRYQTFGWDAALQQVGTVNQDLSLANYDDWRLPNRKELATLINYQCYSPAINDTLFPNTPQVYFWSSSPVADTTKSTWSIYFRHGTFYKHSRTSKIAVRLVRNAE